MGLRNGKSAARFRAMPQSGKFALPRILNIREPQDLVSSERGAELRASDAALMDRIMQRDETALAALYDRYCRDALVRIEPDFARHAGSRRNSPGHFLSALAQRVRNSTRRGARFPAG